MTAIVHLPGTVNFIDLLVVEHYSGYYQLNSPHAYPCPTCGNYRVIVEPPCVGLLDSFEMSCKTCHTIWLVPMNDADLERYINIELDRILDLRQKRDPFMELSLLLYLQKIKYQKFRDEYYNHYGNFDLIPYSDQYEYSARHTL